MSGHRGAKTIEHLPGHPEILKPVRFKNGALPSFIVTVDTEEEFDWNAPFRRDDHGLGHIRKIGRFQTLCEESGVSPIYLVDYPVTTDPFAIETFGAIIANGTGEIGAQLHAWVTPPFHEEVNVRNSFACNLPAALEREKIVSLHGKIESAFSTKPIIYRAGRYGAGPNTVSVLHELGFRIDSSVRSLFDYSHREGPNYAQSSLMPYWLCDDQLFELPVTTVFAGLLRSGGPNLFGRAFESDAARAVLARTKLLERIALTPEGIPLNKAIEAIDIALDMELPVLNFSFHSPSLEPGHTPYVRNEDDLENFYAWWHGVFAHLRHKGVKPTTAKQLSDAAI